MKLRPLHRARRFSGAVFGGPPTEADRDWADRWLSGEERRLFARMSASDQRHAIEVARHAEASLDADPSVVAEAERPPVIAAALLHDVGKVVADLGTYGRVVATLSGVVGGTDYAEHWQESRGLTRKVGLYLRYGELGADLLRVAGSDPLVVAWAAEHHLPEERWTVPPALGRVHAPADR